MSYSSLCVVISKETMIAGFPTLPQPLVGDPTVHDLFGIYQFLRICAQSQGTVLCILNFMFCVVPLNLWNHHLGLVVVPCINQTLVPDPGPTPTYPFEASRTQIQQIKDRWCFQAKNWLEIRNMNKALTYVLFKLLPTAVCS